MATSLLKLSAGSLLVMSGTLSAAVAQSAQAAHPVLSQRNTPMCGPISPRAVSVSH